MQQSFTRGAASTQLQSFFQRLSQCYTSVVSKPANESLRRDAVQTLFTFLTSTHLANCCIKCATLVGFSIFQVAELLDAVPHNSGFLWRRLTIHFDWAIETQVYDITIILPCGSSQIHLSRLQGTRLCLWPNNWTFNQSAAFEELLQRAMTSESNNGGALRLFEREKNRWEGLLSKDRVEIQTIVRHMIQQVVNAHCKHL